MDNMIDNFGKISINQKTGNERLTFNGQETGLKLIDFWQWGVSDIISNATRGKLAEFIVASALSIDLTIVRDEWSPYDLESPDGIKIEVKASSYLQSWKQKDFSKISFSIRTARFWDVETSTYSETPSRIADIYVFCLLNYRDSNTLNPLNLDQWEFYVLPTSSVNNYKRSQSSITLKSLQTLSVSSRYDQLREIIITKYWESKSSPNR